MKSAPPGESARPDSLAAPSFVAWRPPKDYAPGEMVAISLSGIKTGSTYTIQIRDPLSAPGADGRVNVYTHFTVTDGGKGDLEGERSDRNDLVRSSQPGCGEREAQPKCSRSPMPRLLASASPPPVSTRGAGDAGCAKSPPSSIRRASPRICAAAIENLRSGWSEVRQSGGAPAPLTPRDGASGSIAGRRSIRSRSTA